MEAGRRGNFTTLFNWDSAISPLPIGGGGAGAGHQAIVGSGNSHRHIVYIYIYIYICTPGACVGPTEPYPGLGGAYPLLKLWVGVCAACRVGRQGLARYAGCPAVRSGPASRGRYCRTKGDLVVEDLPVANSKGVWGVGPGEECPPFRVRVRVRVRTPYVMKRAGRFISIPPKGLEHNNHLPTD